MPKESKARGFLFYGFFCGAEIPWKPASKSWEEIYRDAVGWPQKPDLRTIPKSEDREQIIRNWAAEDFRNFWNLGVTVEYIEPAGEWLVGTNILLGSDILPREIKIEEFNNAGDEVAIKEFCKILGITFQPCSWYLTAVSFYKEKKEQ